MNVYRSGSAAYPVELATATELNLTIIPWAVRLSCLDNAYSHLFFGGWFWPVK